MVEIRENQLPALAYSSVVEDITLECQRTLPHHCRALGSAGVRAAVTDGIVAARRHSIEHEEGWRAYVRLVFLFDRDFDERLPWARRSLVESEHAEGHQRINSLIAAARAEVQRQRTARER